MSSNFNPYDLSQEVKSMPKFCMAKYIVTGMNAPKKSNDIKDGINCTLMMLEYIPKLGAEPIKTTKVDASAQGVTVTFPEGRTGITANMFRGPKSIYKYKNGDQWREIPRDSISKEGFYKWLKANDPEAKNRSQKELEEMLEDYLTSIFHVGLNMDFGLNPQDGEEVKVGLTRWFYRSYEEPKEGEKYGNVRLTRYMPKKIKEAEAELLKKNPQAHITGFADDLTDAPKYNKSEIAYAIQLQFKKEQEKEADKAASFNPDDYADAAGSVSNDDLPY